MAEANIQPYIDIIRNSTDGDNVRDAIINCMQEINKESKYKVKSKVISGTVGNMETHYVAGSGTVWKDVTLDLKLPDGSEVPESQLVVDDFYVDNNTPNGDHPPESGHRWGTIHVDIDWSQYANEDIAEQIEITTDDLDPNSVYHAETSGFTSMRSIKFSNVKSTAGGMVGPGGQIVYNVEFKNEAGQLVFGPVQVPAGDDADKYYNGPNPPDSGHSGYKIGWKPSGSKSVRRDYTGNNALVVQYDNYSFGDDEIADDWATIARNGGAPYPIGSYKTMILAENQQVNIQPHAWETRCPIIEEQDGSIKILDTMHYVNSPELSFYGQAIKFIKTGSGENGSTSSWIASDPIRFNNAVQFGYYETSIADHYETSDWEDSVWRQLFNSYDFMSLFPSDVRNSIKSVNKPYYGVSSHVHDGQHLASIRKSVNSKIWIPSASEYRNIIRSSYNRDHDQHSYSNDFYKLDETAADYRSIWSNDYSSEAYYSYLICRDTVTKNGGLAILKFSNTADENGHYPFDLESDQFVYSIGSYQALNLIRIGFCL
jgi:hypothetical protein